MVKVSSIALLPGAGLLNLHPCSLPPCVILTTGSSLPEDLVGAACKQTNCPDHDSPLLVSAYLRPWICSLQIPNSLWSLQSTGHTWYFSKKETCCVLGIFCDVKIDWKHKQSLHLFWPSSIPGCKTLRKDVDYC